MIDAPRQLDITCTCTVVTWQARTERGLRITRRTHADECDLGRYIAEHDTTAPNPLKGARA